MADSLTKLPETLRCADCDRPMRRSAYSLPQGQACCLPCRRLRPSVYADRRTGAEAWAARPRLTCADCGAGMQWTESAAQGRSRCHPCRRRRPSPSMLRARAEPVRPVVTHCRWCEVPLLKPSRRSRYCNVDCRSAARLARGAHLFGAAKPSATARGYGVEHQRLRAELLPAAVGTPCVLCGEVMDDPSGMHLDHTEDRSGYRGFACAPCNVRDGARRGNAAMAAQRRGGAGRG